MSAAAVSRYSGHRFSSGFVYSIIDVFSCHRSAILPPSPTPSSSTSPFFFFLMIHVNGNRRQVPSATFRRQQLDQLQAMETLSNTFLFAGPNRNVRRK